MVLVNNFINILFIGSLMMLGQTLGDLRPTIVLVTESKW